MKSGFLEFARRVREDFPEAEWAPSANTVLRAASGRRKLWQNRHSFLSYRPVKPSEVANQEFVTYLSCPACFSIRIEFGGEPGHDDTRL